MLQQEPIAFLRTCDDRIMRSESRLGQRDQHLATVLGVGRFRDQLARHEFGERAAVWISPFLSAFITRAVAGAGLGDRPADRHLLRLGNGPRAVDMINNALKGSLDVDAVRYFPLSAAITTTRGLARGRPKPTNPDNETILRNPRNHPETDPD